MPAASRRPRNRVLAAVVAAVLGSVAVLAGPVGCAPERTGSGTSSSGSPSPGSSSSGSPASSATQHSTVPYTAALPPVVPVTPAAPAVDPRTVPGPYVAAVTWDDTPYGPTLKVAPTPAGRRTGGVVDVGVAWREVLSAMPGADTPGMQAQFRCHWTFARALEPDKPTWNLEPWRPVVTDGEMVLAGCNPGGPEV